MSDVLGPFRTFESKSAMKSSMHHGSRAVMMFDRKEQAI